MEASGRPGGPEALSGTEVRADAARLSPMQHIVVAIRQGQMLFEISLSLSLSFRGPGNRDVELRRRRCGIRVPYVGLPSRINMLSGSHSEKGPRNGGRDGCGRTHLYLNVYDLTPINKYLYWFGLGIFHSGIEGAPSSRRNLGIWITRSVWLGTTDMSRSEFRILIEDFAGKYHGDTYNLIIKNCNHFTDELCMHLTGKPIPGWVNRLARLG
ncbi:hypothetical protein B296_00019742 [Ensete ventricosum]|uniref:PPPDE domain-containing protein n=1 Tax=Ensete ventricosum TaxID=4639 RepID=A0A427AHJ6_ENSVE|nr:hypothetical protein B296_00019742 [Ensete ventricosum]